MKQFLIWDDLATYRGEGFLTGRHSHFFIQISLPDSGVVQLRTRGAEWETYRAAFIPSGVSHTMRNVEGPVTLIFLNPLTTGYNLFHNLRKAATHPVFDVGDFFTSEVNEQIKAILKTPSATIRSQIIDILDKNFARNPEMPRLDARIEKSISHIDLEDFSLAGLAEEAGLSVERFRHLFRQEIGVPFSAYRLWLKTKRAVDHLANRTHLLDAAYEGGFADQAHFSRIFRRSFGVNPSDFTKKKDPFSAIFYSR